jgi:predicted RNase H-like nuclease (RuvC/YqgF family)
MAAFGEPAGEPGTDGLEAQILGILGRGLASSVSQKIAIAKELEDHALRQEQEIADLSRQIGKVEGYVEHLRREHDALAAEYQRSLAHVEELQAYVHRMEEEFSRVDQLVNEWGVRRELAEQHASRLEGRLSELQEELRQRESQLEELAARWSVRRTLRRLTGPVS